PLPDSSRERHQVPVAAYRAVIPSRRRGIVAVKAPRIRSPLALEVRQHRLVLGDFSQVVAAKAAATRLMNRVPLDDVVRSEREGIASAPIEGIECGVAVRQYDGTRQQAALPGGSVLGE